jgi:transposase
MVMTVEGADPTLSESRRLAAASRDASAALRMLALALVLEGMPRAVAAETCAMDRQTLRDWVHRDNAEGPSGLSNHKEGVGRKSPLTADKVEVVAELVRTAPPTEPRRVCRRLFGVSHAARGMASCAA